MIKNFTFKVAGVPHHVDDFFDALAVENSDYNLSKKEIKEDFSDGDKIFEYDFSFSKVELIPEDTNPYDKNAVRIEADGHVVGYIGKNDTLKVRDLLNNPELFKIELNLAGGNYKYVSEDEDGKVSVEEKSYGYYGDVTIKIGTPEASPVYTSSDPVVSETTKEPAKHGGVLFILGIIDAVLSLVMLLLSPVVGVISLLLAVYFIIMGSKLKKKRKLYEESLK